MKLLIDMNLSPLWVDFLGLAGIEAMHWASVGKRDAADTEIMAYAAAKDDIVLTHDLDFGAILAATNGAKQTPLSLRTNENLSRLSWPGLSTTHALARPRKSA